MIETYSHARMEAKADVVSLLGTSGHNTAATPDEPAPPPQAALSLDLMQPAIQAEIARQVALALHQEREERYYVSATKQSIGPRLVVFPGKGHERA